MNGFVVELPSELKAEIARRAGEGSAKESAWVADAVRQKIEACKQLEYLAGRAIHGSREAYEQVLSKVPAVAPIVSDEQ